MLPTTYTLPSSFFTLMDRIQVGYVDAAVLVHILYTFHYYLEARNAGYLPNMAIIIIMIDTPEGPYGQIQMATPPHVRVPIGLSSGF
jgi:hypothetical protein